MKIIVKRTKLFMGAGAPKTRGGKPERQRFQVPADGRPHDVPEWIRSAPGYSTGVQDGSILVIDGNAANYNEASAAVIANANAEADKIKAAAAEKAKSIGQTLLDDAKAEVELLLENGKAEAQRLADSIKKTNEDEIALKLADAKAEAGRLLEKAKYDADAALAEAKAEAERILEAAKQQTGNDTPATADKAETRNAKNTDKPKPQTGAAKQ